MSAENHDDFADQSDPVRFNQVAWDQMAGSGNQYYRAVTKEQIAAARYGEWKIRITPQRTVPRDWLAPWPDAMCYVSPVEEDFKRRCWRQPERELPCLI